MTSPIVPPYILNNPELTRRIANGEQIPQQQPQGLGTPPAVQQGPPQPDMHVQVTHKTEDEGPDLGTSVPGRLAPMNAAAQPRPLIPPPPTVPKSSSELAHEAEYSRLTAPPPANPALLHTKQNTGAPGVQQVHNPIGRGFLTALDAIGSGLFPNIAMNIPGTTAHHGLLVAQQKGPLEQEELERNREEAQRLEEAKAQYQMSMETKATKPDIHALYAAAVDEAVQAGRDPKDDPKVQQILGAMTATTAKEPKEPQSNEALLADLIREEQKAGRDPSQNPKYKQILDAIHATQKPPAEKEAETPIGDERAAASNAAIDRLYKEAGLPTPTSAQLTGKHSKADEARIIDFAKSEIASHRTNQEFNQRERDRQTQMAINQSNKANDQLNRAQDNFNKNMGAELKPLQEQIDNVQEARRLINGGSVQQFLGTVKTLVATAGGRGSGVRITQAELNGIPSARGVAGGFEGFVNSLAGKGRLASGQIQQINQALGEIEAVARAKQERLNKYMDQAVTARDPGEIRKIEQSYRHEQMQANQGGGGKVSVDGFDFPNQAAADAYKAAKGGKK